MRERTNEEWLAELQSATIKADLNRMLALAEQVREQDAALADALGDLIRSFRYKRLLALIQRAGGMR